MKCFFKNINENNEVFYGEILTSFKNFQRQSYIDLTMGLSLDGKIDWKDGHIYSVYKENILGFYEDIEGFKKDYPQYFI